MMGTGNNMFAMGMGNKGDIENGGQGNSNQLYPSQIETPELRWAFIRKVYSIVSFQLLFTATFASIFIFVEPARKFAQDGMYRFYVAIGCIIVSLLVLLPLSKLYKKHPINFVLLGIYTLCMSLAVGFVCAVVKGNLVMLALLLTGVVVLSLTAYTFWAVKRGHDFGFLGPFLFAACMVMLVFCLLQIIFHLGPVARTIYSGLGALIMCAFIVYDTNNLIKVYTYDEYIWAAIAIYGDIIQLFLHLLNLLNDIL